jgi:arginyl-tRNA synthetase
LGVETAHRPQTVVVDYSGPNVAKEMHVGHLRSTIIGDAISRVLEFQGHKIIRQNHIGDWGTQFGMLIEHLADTFGMATVLSASFQIGDLNVFYQEAKKKFDSDLDFANRSRKRVVMLQNNDPDTHEAWRLLTVESLEHFDNIYDPDGLGVKLTDEDIRGESFYNDSLPQVVAALQQSGLAVESDGALVVFIDGPGKAPMIVRKGDGAYLYSTTDLAAIRYRVNQLHAQRIIYVHDARQSHHFRQLFAVARQAHWADGVELDYAPFGMMCGEDGKPFKTRSGGTVKLKDLLDEAEQRALAVVTSKNPDLPAGQRQSIAHAVGIGAVKYADLAKDRIADYVFSFDKILALDGNTAPYLQYAHARIRSIFRKAGDYAGRITLDSPFEVSLAKQILRLGEVIEQVSRDLKPHLLCTYLYDLAAKFSGFYENCPVIQSAPPLRSSRLALCDLTARTLELGLDLLGIQHPDQM